MPLTPVLPGEIQVRRCQWILYGTTGIVAWKSAGYLVITGPGERRHWRPTRRRAINLARQMRAQRSGSSS